MCTKPYLRDSGAIYATAWGGTTGMRPILISAIPRHLGPGRLTVRPVSSASECRKPGTTWWFRLIVDHPGSADVLPEDKELHFFARFGTQSFGPLQTLRTTTSSFLVEVSALTGRSTTDYLYYPWVPPLLAKARTDTKLLLILRDPIERFRSGLASEIRNGAAHVGATIAEVVGYTMYAGGSPALHGLFPPLSSCSSCSTSTARPHLSSSWSRRIASWVSIPSTARQS